MLDAGIDRAGIGDLRDLAGLWLASSRRLSSRPFHRQRRSCMPLACHRTK
jgi:hypothetical protein